MKTASKCQTLAQTLTDPNIARIGSGDHMMGKIHAFDLLANPPAEVPGGICVLFGGERFLKRLASKALVRALSRGEDDFSATEFVGDTACWPDIVDELSTLSLFGGDGPRIVVVDQADGFVKQNRDRLEDLVATPPKHGVLVLIVDSWASNTRLYKQIDNSSIHVECGPPVIQRGRSKQRDEKKIVDWIVARARDEYGFNLPTVGAQTLIELTECEFGRIDQELAKLCLYADDKGNVDQKQIASIVGGWQTETMWNAIDAATEGNAAVAIQLIDQLLKSGEHPLALFGQISWSLRRYAEAAEIVARQQREGRVNLNDALKQAGFRAWGGEMEKAGARLKQLGRERAFRIYDWLLEADLALKRSHSRADRGRIVLEQLFARMAAELKPQAVSSR